MRRRSYGCKLINTARARRSLCECLPRQAQVGLDHAWVGCEFGRLALEHGFLPAHLCPDLLSHDFSRESLYDVLQNQYGWHLVRAQQTVEARLATKDEWELLNLKHPAPILAIERITMVEQGFPIEFVRSAYRGDRYKFTALLSPTR